MTVVTTEALQDYLTKLYAAREAVLTGQSYTINGRSLVRANAEWISKEIEKTEARLTARGGETSVNLIFRRNR